MRHMYVILVTVLIYAVFAGVDQQSVTSMFPWWNRDLLNWKKLSRASDFNPSAHLHSVIEEYKESNSKLFKTMINNPIIADHLDKLKNDAIARQLGICVSLFKGDKNAALQTAVRNGNVFEAFALMISNGKRLHKDFDLKASLVLAVLNDHPDIVSILLKDVNLRSNMKIQVFKKMEIQELCSSFVEAAGSGNVFQVISIVLSRPEFDLTCSNNMALKKALENDHESIIKYLLTKQEVNDAINQRINAISSNYETLHDALIKFCKNGNYDAVLDLVISDKVNLSADNNAAILTAFRNGHERIIRILQNSRNVQDSLYSIRQSLLVSYGDLKTGFMNACDLGKTEYVLAIIHDPLSGGLTTSDILFGLKKAYDNNHLDTARVISRITINKNKFSNLYEELENRCRNGDAIGTIQILASGLVDPSFQSNRVLIAPFTSGHPEIIRILMKDPRVAEMAKNNNDRLLSKYDQDGVKAMLFACESGNFREMVSLLILDDKMLDPSKFAIAALMHSLKNYNIGVFNVLFRSAKITGFLRQIVFDLFVKQKGDLEKSYQYSCEDKNLDGVLAIINFLLVGPKQKGKKYSDSFIEKGLLRLDRSTAVTIARIPELEQSLQGHRVRISRVSKTWSKTEGFEFSCATGDMMGVCAFLLTPDFSPTLKGLQLALISQHNHIVNFLIKDTMISNSLSSMENSLMREFNGDKIGAFRKACTSNDTLGVMVLTISANFDIDPSENDNQAIKTALNNHNGDMLMVLGFNQKVFNSFQKIRTANLYQGNNQMQALIDACREGLVDQFLAIFLIDILSGSLDASFSSNLALKTAIKNGHYAFANLLMRIHNVRLLHMAEKKKLVSNSITWKFAFMNAVASGRFDDVAILATDAQDVNTLVKGLNYANKIANSDIANYLINIIPLEKRIHQFRLACTHAVRGHRNHPFMIHRDNVLEDGINVFSGFESESLKSILFIKLRFINSLGLIEGDGNQFGPGPFKELMEEIWRSALEPRNGLFEGTEKGEVIISSHPKADPATLNTYFQLGRILGKALLCGVSLNVPFPIHIYAKFMNQNHDMEDLKSLDAELYKNLIWLYNYEGNMEDLGLTFSITEKVNDPRVASFTHHDLLPNGSEILVDQQNKYQYIHRVVEYKLYEESSLQYANLINGFQNMIKQEHARLFSPSELKYLMYGDIHPFDIAAMKPYVKFVGTLFDRQTLISNFWQVLQGFTPEQQRDFLFFVTSSYRPPSGGFQYLDPPLTIEFSTGISKESLPNAMTCINTLYLSPFYTKDEMEKKIKTVISLNDGFFFQ